MIKPNRVLIPGPSQANNLYNNLYSLSKYKMASLGYLNKLTVLRYSFLRGSINRALGGGYLCLKKCPDEQNEALYIGVRWAYQSRAKLKRKASEVPGYRIGVTKAWDSWHTGSLAGSSQASERLMDDIMLRKFIEGVFYELLVSDIVIKRRDNQIIVAFYAAGQQDPIKLYFLVGFSERILTELFGCIVKLEVVSQLVKTKFPPK